MDETCSKLNPDLMNTEDVKDAEKVIENTIEAITNSDIPLEEKKATLQKLNENRIKLKNIYSIGKTGAFYLILGIFSLTAEVVKSLALDEKDVYKNVVLTRNSMLSTNIFGHCSNLAESQVFNGAYNIAPNFNIPIDIKNGDLDLGTSYVQLYANWNSYIESLSQPDIIKTIRKTYKNNISYLKREINAIKFVNYFDDETRYDYGMESSEFFRVALQNKFNTTEGIAPINVGFNYEPDLYRSVDPNFSKENKPALIKLMKLLTDTTIPPDKYYGGGAIAKKEMTKMIKANLDYSFNTFVDIDGFIPDKIYTTTLTISSVDGNFYSNGRSVYSVSNNHALVLYMRLIDGTLKYGIMDIQNLYGNWDNFQSFSEDGEFDGKPFGIFETGFWKAGDLFYENLSKKVVQFDDPFLYLVKTWADKDEVPKYFPSISINYNLNTLTSTPLVSTLDNFIAYTYKLGQAYLQASKKGYITKWKLDGLLNYYNKDDRGHKAFDWLFENFYLNESDGSSADENIIPNKYKNKLIKWYLDNENDILSIQEQKYYKKMDKQLVLQINQIQKLKKRMKIKSANLKYKINILKNRKIISEDKFLEFATIIQNSRRLISIQDDLSNIKLLTDNYKILMEKSKEIHKYLHTINIKPYRKIIEVYDKIERKIKEDPSLLDKNKINKDGTPDKHRYNQWKDIVIKLYEINLNRNNLYEIDFSSEKLSYLIEHLNMIYDVISHDIYGKIIDPEFKEISLEPEPEPEQEEKINIPTIITLVDEWLFPLNNTLASYFVVEDLNSKYEKINKFHKNFEETELSKIGDEIEQSQLLKREDSPKYIPFKEPKQSWFQTTRKKWLGWGGKQKRKTQKRKGKIYKRKRRFTYKK
jgi:hypothetical protein